jgi:RES domain-containing protein
MDVLGWRVTRAKYVPPAGDPFDGKGAERVGGRWNSPGVPVVYLSCSVSLAVLETLVHSDSLKSLVDRAIASVSFRQEDITDAFDRFDTKTLAEEESRGFGDRWAAAGKTPVLRIPSIVIPCESNYVLSCNHPDFPRIRATASKWQALPIDRRLLGLK